MEAGFLVVFGYRRSVLAGESHIALMFRDPLADRSAGFAHVDLVALVTRYSVQHTSASSTGDLILRTDELIPQGGGGFEGGAGAVIHEDAV